MRFRFLTAFLLALFITPALAAPGDLDTTFGGGDGWVSTPITRPDLDQARSVIQQADGKLVAAGYGYSYNGSSNNDFNLVRYNSDGTLDTTFNGTGKLITAIGASDDLATSVIQQADGKLVVAGYSYNGSNDDFALVRVNSDGSLDTTFNGTGKLTTAIGVSTDQAYSVIQQADGKLVAAGWSNGDFALVRYSSDGTLDTTFNGTGKLTTVIGASTDIAYSVIQQADGKLVAAGYSSVSGYPDFALVRVNSDGTLDTTFNGTGKLTTAIGGSESAQSVIQQADGKLVAAGYSNDGSNNDFALMRYNFDGSLDTTFDGDGKLTTAIGAGNDYGRSVIQQADGKLVVAGYSYNGSNDDLALARYNSDGSLDTAFNSTGKLTTTIGVSRDVAYSVIQQADGRLVAAGYSTNGSNNDFALVRVNSDGSLDTTFDTDGKLLSNIAETSEARASSMIQQADGKLVVAGSSYNGSNDDFALVRYNIDGSLDNTFNGTGKLTTDTLSAAYGSAQSVIQQADGKLVVAGSNGDFALMRVNSDGTLDTSFNGTGKLTTDIRSAVSDFAQSVIQQADGKLVAAGYSYSYNGSSSNDFALVRYNSDGSLDTTFNGIGKLTTDFGYNDVANSVIQQADGKLVAAGSSYNGLSNYIALARYNSDGSLDTTFNGTGQLTTAIGALYGGWVNSVIQQTDGKLVAAGSSHNGSNYDVALVRYNSDGSLDTTFNSSGKLATAIGAANDYAQSVVQQADGKLVATGWSSNGSNNDVVLVRYNGDGSLDTTFSGDGKLTMAIGTSDDLATSVIQQVDGQLAVAGYSSKMPTGQEFVVARFESGQLDTDGDGYIDGLDTDDDNDGVADISDAFPLDATESVDADGDGIGDNADTDDDNDGVADVSDAFPLDATESVDTDSDTVGDNADNCVAVANTNQLDTDTDGAGDVCDSTPNGDTDNDGIDNAADNCPLIANSNQLDYDADNIGDACDDSVPLPEDIAGVMKNAKAGSAVAFAGDVNGDGYGDYVIGMPGYDIPAVPPVKAIKGAGRAEVISGKTGAVLMSVNGVAAKDMLGFAVAGNGDIDNDGFDDVVVGAPKADDTQSGIKDAGSAILLYGPNGERSQTFFGAEPKSQFGYAISVTDANNDGHADILIGAPKDNDVWPHSKKVGSVSLFSGENNSLLVKWYGGVSGWGFGSSVLLADLDADGIAEIIVGSPYATYAGYSSGSGDGTGFVMASTASNWRGEYRRAGQVSVYGLVEGYSLWSTGLYTNNALFGSSLAVADVNADGINELIVGAPGYVGINYEGNMAAGSVSVITGNVGWELEIWRVFGGSKKTGFGLVVSAGDVNGDGYDDIIVGEPKATKNTGSVSVWSGSDYSLITTLYGEKKGDLFGAAVSAGDINSDGKSDLIIGIPGFDALPILPAKKSIKEAGSVKVLSGAGL